MRLDPGTRMPGYTIDMPTALHRSTGASPVVAVSLDARGFEVLIHVRGGIDFIAELKRRIEWAS